MSLPANRPLRLAFVFVCQSGRLQTQACLLAASLRKYGPGEAQLFCGVPGPVEVWPAPSEDVLDFLRSLDVELFPLANQIDPTYAIGNKIGCLSITPDADRLILMDSDMVVMRPWEDQGQFAIAFNARAAAAPSFSDIEADWERVYQACAAIPLRGKVCTTYTRELIAPYFNSAFVAVPADINFGATWLSCCQAIDTCEGIPNKRPYLDQIALPPAISKLGMEYACLPERFNYPINFKPMTGGNLPMVCHYHEAMTLAREPAGVNEVGELCKQHPALGRIIEADGEWDCVRLLLKKRMSQVVSVPELLITGIPRSGTSFLCNLLHRHTNCVVLNEPVEIGGCLESAAPPWPLARFLRDIRRDVLLGKPIRNKLVNGQVVEDTTMSNEQVEYQPEVENENFVLGMKSTVPFLSRLEHLRAVMPEARFVACVRNPLDTIASWKSSFAHLSNAAVHQTRIGNPDDPWLSGVDRARLEAVGNIKEPAWRRAAWWQYLAELILARREWLIVVRYEDLVENSGEAVERVMKGWDAGKARQTGSDRTILSKRHYLDADDITAIRALCSDAAMELGVYGAGM